MVQKCQVPKAQEIALGKTDILVRNRSKTAIYYLSLIDLHGVYMEKGLFTIKKWYQGH